MSAEKKYKANVKKFQEILKDMPFKKSDFDLNIKVEGCGTRIFSYLSLGQRKYPIEIYEKLADEFTKQYKTIDPKKIIKTKDLINPNSNDEGLQNFFLTDEFSCTLEEVKNARMLTQGGFTSPNVERVFINHTRTNNEIADCVEKIFDGIDSSYNSIDQSHALNNSGIEKSKDQINNLKLEAEINNSLDILLKKHKVNIYEGHLFLPFLEFEHDSGLYEFVKYKSCLHHKVIQVFLISYSLKNEPKITYKEKFPFSSTLEAAKFISDNPVEITDTQNNLNAHQIKSKIAEEYYEKNDKLFPIVFVKEYLVFKNLELKKETEEDNKKKKNKT